MKRKHSRTLAAIFKSQGGLEWTAIEALLVAVGCTVIEGSGSRVKFEKNGVIASFHRPHPEKEAKFYQIRDAKEFLEKIGETP